MYSYVDGVYASEGSYRTAMNTSAVVALVLVALAPAADAPTGLARVRRVVRVVGRRRRAALQLINLPLGRRKLLGDGGRRREPPLELAALDLRRHIYTACTRAVSMCMGMPP